MKKSRKRFLFTLCGQTGATGLSLVTLWLALWSESPSPAFFGWATLALMVFRVTVRLSNGPKPILESDQVVRHARRVLSTEVAIATMFICAAFLLGWPLTRQAALAFFGLNLAAQLVKLLAVRVVLTYMRAREPRHHDRSCEQQALIIGTGRQAKAIADQLMDSPELDTLLIGFLDYHRNNLWRYRDVPLIGHPDRLPEIIATCQIDALIIAVEAVDLPQTREVFEIAEQMGVTVCLMSEIFPTQVSRVRSTSISGMPSLVYRAVPENQLALLAKSLLDRIGALVGIVLTAPIMLAAALWVKLDSPGPILFKQVRTGLNGRSFQMLKFRTMVVDAEARQAALHTRNEMSGPVFKIKDDPRITRPGRFLRRYSIDELPQFFNVLMGQMSLVGPRPPLPKEVADYEPWQHRKLSVKPGLTCLWQVNGRNSIDFEDWMKLDLEYIDNWSLLLDAKILARTLPAVFKSDGAS